MGKINNLQKHLEKQSAEKAARLIPVVKEYRKMMAKHIDKSYIIDLLCVKYEVSKRTIYNYIKNI